MTVRVFMADIWREWRLAMAVPVMPLTLISMGILTSLALLAGQLRVEQRVEFQEMLKRENALQRSFVESAFVEDESTGATMSELTPIQSDRQFELQMSAKSPDLMRYIGGIWWAVYPASPLSSLSMGATGKWPDHYHHEGSSVSRTLNRSAHTNPLLATIGAFDLTLLVGAILPLAVIVLTYNVVASDREQGRWSLVELQAPSSARLIVLRCLVRTSTLAIVVVTLTTSCILIAEASEFDMVAMRNLLVWTIWLTAYLAFWTALAVAVNSLQLSSSGAGLLLLLCWTTLVIAVPSLVQREVNRGFRIPPRSQIIIMEEEVEKQVEQESEEVWATFLRENTDIEVDSENPQQEYLMRDVVLSRIVRSRVHERLDEYYGRFLDRESLLDRCQYLSPLLAWRTAADHAAGTSLRHFLDFADQTSRFHEQYIRYFEPFSIAGKELSLEDVRAIPRFGADQLQTRLYWPPLLMSAGALLFWTAAAGVFSWWSFRRCSIRQ